ncbi:MAG: glycosyltransferase [Candidatus Baltobacteraceae bacterium]|jgi:glycosyltransferase involved in cell wall biosynthesis
MLKVTVAVAGSCLPAWHERCIAALRARSDRLDVRVVTVGAPAWTPPKNAAARLAGRALAPVSVPAEPGGLEGADVVVNLTSSTLEAGAPLGVWFFRLDRSDDATFPFAREIARGARTLEISLLRQRGDAREVLRSGRFAVTVWHPSTLRIALWTAAEWPATFAAAAAAGLELDASADRSATQRRPLGPFERARFAASLARRLGAWTLQQHFCVEGWDVGLLAAGPEPLLAGAPLDVRWILASDRTGFSADPFAVVRDGRRAVFFEAYDHERKRGVIDAALLDDGGRVAQVKRVIERTTHLSYPCPFEAEGQLFLAVENYASKEVPLYRCTEFPWRWEPQPPLLPGFDAVDTTLFEHGGRWWAFCTRYSQGPTLALFAFHAPSFRGPWSPHALNPVVVDVASARPAGRPFVVDGVLYRPGQDCSRTYGGGVVVARVDRLTPTAYRETIVRRLDGSSLRPAAAGIHTIDFAAGLATVDGKRVVFDPLKPAQGLRLRTRFARRRATPANGKPHPLRVVHVCAQLGSYGAENVVTRLMQYTREPDVALTTMTLSRWAHPEVRRTLDFPIVEIGRRGRFDLLFLARMIGELRRLRPDVVHTHAHHGRYWGRLAAVLAGVPLIVHTEHNSELRPPPPRALFDSLNRWLAPRTTAFVTFNRLRQAALSAAERIPTERIAVIPNGIPIVESDPAARDRARAELSLRPEDLAILMLSRLSSEKRIDLALQAVAALPAPRRARVQLLLLGDGPLQEELETLARELGIAGHVRFLGFRSDARALLAGADVLLLTSAREAMPLAVIEAMVEGVPVVSVPWSGAEALLEHDRFGRITAGYEPAAISAALEAVFADPVEAFARADAARAHARVEYDVATQARRYVDLYRTLSVVTRSANDRMPAARS